MGSGRTTAAFGNLCRPQKITNYHAQTFRIGKSSPFIGRPTLLLLGRPTRTP